MPFGISGPFNFMIVFQAELPPPGCRLQPRLPQLGRGHVLPWEVSSTNSLAERDLYERAGRRERAELEARLGVDSWDLHEVGAFLYNLKY